jgi:hypothetical protein
MGRVLRRKQKEGLSWIETYWLKTLQQGSPQLPPSRVVIGGNWVNKVTPQFLQISKTTKGERLSKKVKIESTNNEGKI